LGQEQLFFLCVVPGFSSRRQLRYPAHAQAAAPVRLALALESDHRASHWFLAFVPVVSARWWLLVGELERVGLQLLLDCRTTYQAAALRAAQTNAALAICGNP